MTSRERLLAVLDGRLADHVPLTTWCFGFRAPPHLRWQTDGRDVRFWYSKRLEHIHTLPQPWELEDELKRAEAWVSLGVDDVLEISVPWGQDPAVIWTDSLIPPGPTNGELVMVREYRTPAGPLRHAVRKTEPEPEGWPVQPGHVPLIEDLNIPRAVQHLVDDPRQVPAVRHLFAPPGEEERLWFAERMAAMKTFADTKGLLVQAWTAFGMDAAVWFMGAQNAVLMAMDVPDAFAQLLDIVFETDFARTELAVATPGVDMVCQRGWYSSTDFWSPKMFDRLVVPRLRQLTALAHRYGKKFAYVMTTGVKTLGTCLADAGVDLLYFADPVQDRLPLEKARELAGRMALAGGTNALSLASGDAPRIREEVRRAIEVLGPTRRFILHPVDAIFPDTPWAGVETMIQAWKEFRDL